MASELRKTILETEDLQKELVHVPEWDVDVEVRSMTGKERARIMRVAAEGTTVNLERWFPEIVIASAYDPDTGEKLFEPADRDALNAKNGAALNRLAVVGQRLAGLMESDVEAAKEGFAEAQSDDSISS
jgi:hypothetical protein